MSVWVEIGLFLELPLTISSRSTWACELKCSGLFLLLCFAPSRSTWACELKFLKQARKAKIVQSRSTWACELKCSTHSANRGKSASRSTWACELKYTNSVLALCVYRHAPRERVSWNSPYVNNFKSPCVTLHVSVWVEILVISTGCKTAMSRSTWACELKLDCKYL